MSENYNASVIAKLQTILDTKDLSDYLKDQVLGFLCIITDENTTEEKKYFTQNLAQDLNSNTSDLPDIKTVNKIK